MHRTLFLEYLAFSFSPSFSDSSSLPLVVHPELLRFLPHFFALSHKNTELIADMTADKLERRAKRLIASTQNKKIKCAMAAQLFLLRVLISDRRRHSA